MISSDVQFHARGPLIHDLTGTRAWPRVSCPDPEGREVEVVSGGVRGGVRRAGHAHLGPVVAGSVGKYVSVVIEAASRYGLI